MHLQGMLLKFCYYVLMKFSIAPLFVTLLETMFRKGGIVAD